MSDVGWTLSGIDAERWRIQAGSVWRPPVSVRRDVLTIPNVHGTVPTGKPPVYEETTVTLELLCAGVQADMEALAGELTGILTVPGLVLGRYSGGLTTTADAAFVSLTGGEFVPDQGAFLTAALAVPGVFFRQPVAESAPVVITSGDTVTVTTLAGSTAPITDAILRVTGPATSFSGVDVVNGTGLSWTGDLPAGQYLFLDADAVTARISESATDWTTGGADVSAGLDYPAPGELQLQPRHEGTDPGDRRCKLTVTGTGFTAATALAVRAAPAHL